MCTVSAFPHGPGPAWGCTPPERPAWLGSVAADTLEWELKTLCLQTWNTQTHTHLSSTLTFTKTIELLCDLDDKITGLEIGSPSPEQREAKCPGLGVCIKAWISVSNIFPSVLCVRGFWVRFIGVVGLNPPPGVLVPCFPPQQTPFICWN